MLLYADHITTRLQYISDFIGRELLGEAFELTTEKDSLKNRQEPYINYSREYISVNEFRIEPYVLLFENDIRPQPVSVFMNNPVKAFFQSGGDFPFDIFAASFYLMSRYEEYLPHEKDMYGRYAHANSLAFRHQFLQQPLINTWIKELGIKLKLKFPGHLFPGPEQKIPFLPTYDIDQAYSFKYKSFWKNAGGFIKALASGNRTAIKERRNVLDGRRPDPFDAFTWMDQLHQRYSLTPMYFFIIAGKPGKYDKNIAPGKKAMRDLIIHLSNRYRVGIHPSWQSGDDVSLLEKEITQLNGITGKRVTDSRQHYIRFTLPQTFRQLIKAGILQDYSMGYGSINGFRASVASSFYWFDLEKNERTKLMLHPFCFMDANSFYEQRDTPQQAGEEMMQYYNAVKKVNGTMIAIWHNNFLGTDKLYEGWKEVYEKFIDDISTHTPSGSGNAGVL